MKSPIHSAFKAWKIALAIAVGLLISSWMLYRGLSATQFIAAEEKTATHKWIDANHNNTIDYADEYEFLPSAEGGFRRVSAVESLKAIVWYSNTYFWLIAAL